MAMPPCCLSLPGAAGMRANAHMHALKHAQPSTTNSTASMPSTRGGPKPNAQHNGVIKSAEVVTLTQLRLGFLAEAVNRCMPDFIAQSLPGPCTIAIDFPAHFIGVRAIIFDKPVNGLLSRPTLRMKPRVDHQTTGAEGQRLQIAQTPHREIIIDAQLVGDLLRV